MAPDVIVIGAGPVGLTAALLMARHGLRVEVIERSAGPVTEPRAVALDDEGLRIWQACGLDDVLGDDWAGGREGQCICTYTDDRGRPFLKIHQRHSELGHPHAVTIHQGRIEEKLLLAVERHASIRVRRGTAVQSLTQDADGVVVGCADSGGHTPEIRAPWLMACDGAGSTVRQLLGIEMRVEELPRPWLVANLVDRGEPGHVMVRCDAAGAAVTVPLPHGLRRVEVELAEGDSGEWLGDAAQVRARLARAWAGAADAQVMKAAICRFRAGVAERWRVGRVFLAGDAAHTMPPFAGQGLCAGLRDAANLSFKIAGACQGWLAPGVLETYEAERRPHVVKMTRLACRLGRLMTPRSVAECRLVHGAVRLLSAAPVLGGRWLLRGPSIQPELSQGFVVASGRAGRYLPQPTVVAPGLGCVRLDELLGSRMTWLVLAGRAGDSRRLHAPLMQPSDTVLMEGRDFRDPRGVLRRHFGAGSLVLVRPDRFVYCHIRGSGHSSNAIRRLVCRPDTVALRLVRQVAACSARRSPLPSARSAGASPTAQTRLWKFARPRATNGTRPSSWTWPTPAGGTSLSRASTTK